MRRPAISVLVGSMSLAVTCRDPPIAPAPVPTGPSVSPPGPTPTPMPPVQMTFTVKDGWTGAPVAGAEVTVEADVERTDADGQARMTLTPPVRARIQASGYLERITFSDGGVVTLWPVANATEEAATRAAAFPSGLRWRTVAPATLILDPGLLQRRPEVGQIWRKAADEAMRLTGGRLVIQFTDRLMTESAWEIAPVATDTSCGYFRPFDLASHGFCLSTTRVWEVDRINLRRDVEDQPEVALRALLGVFVLGPHPLPGLMNATRPDANLSEFERKTVHMLVLRWPYPGVWPDIDHR